MPYPVTCSRVYKACLSAHRTLTTHIQSRTSFYPPPTMSTSPLYVISMPVYQPAIITPVIPMGTAYVVQAAPPSQPPPQFLSVSSWQICMQMLAPEACVPVLLILNRVRLPMPYSIVIPSSPRCQLCLSHSNDERPTGGVKRVLRRLFSRL